MTEMELNVPEAILKSEPKAISASESHKRLQRIAEISTKLGFVGSVEYRHAYSQSGGAQYCIGPAADGDIMILYAEAFERDANPDDFPLEAMIAHECGHQRLHRNSRFREVMVRFPGEEFEEVLASLVGCVLLGDDLPSRFLLWRAVAELGDRGMSGQRALAFAERLVRVMEQLL